MVSKLKSVLCQQYFGLLALFVALGGSAYAAATINSASVVDNSLTGADVRGRAAKPGKPFTQGSITGEDVRGSVATPGRAAVNGSLSGADVANNSLTGADVFESSLGRVPSAADATKLGGHDAIAYGHTFRASHQRTSACDDFAYNRCAKVTVTVPAGRQYHAAVWSSFTVATSGISSIGYCPAVEGPSLQITCLTGVPPPGADRITLPANDDKSADAFGETSALGFNLGEGTWTFSTLLSPATTLIDESDLSAHTLVEVTDATAPSPSGVTGTSGSSGTCVPQNTSSGNTSGSSSGGSTAC